MVATMAQKGRNWQSERTLIYVLPETKEKLKQLGRMGNTYDDVITTILQFVDKNKNQYCKFLDSKKGK